MHEQRLELAFREVDDAHEQRESLQRGRRRGGGVDVGAQEVDKRVEEERADVFGDEDCAPGYLGAWR